MNATDKIDAARINLLLGELRLPGIKLIWTALAETADKEGWPAARFLAALAEQEMVERSRRRFERHLEEARLPPGKTDDGNVAIPLGSILTPEAAHAGRNFLAPAIHTFVRHALIMREDGAAMDEYRLFANSLSSMPMSFNLFAPLALDLELATTVFRMLLPDFVDSVDHIHFETSPGRR